MFSIPLIDLYLPGFSFVLYRLFLNILYNVSLIKELFPDPETPVTHINLPKGNLTSTFFKLL